MMNYAQYFCYISILCLYTALAFQKTSCGIRNRARRISVAAPDHDVDDEVRYSSIVVSGFLSKENDFAETSVFSKLFKAKKWAQVTSVTDNIKFARKRLMSPQLVYSGLSDVLSFAEVDKSDESMETAIQGKDVWLSYNVTSAELLVYAKIAAKVGVKRVIFAVNVPIEESGDGVTFTSAVETLAAANIQYTIFKFGETRKIGEAKYPYRIVGGEMALPKEGNDILSSDDLTRVSQRNESKSPNIFITTMRLNCIEVNLYLTYIFDTSL